MMNPDRFDTGCPQLNQTMHDLAREKHIEALRRVMKGRETFTTQEYTEDWRQSLSKIVGKPIDSWEGISQQTRDILTGWNIVKEIKPDIWAVLY